MTQTSSGRDLFNELAYEFAERCRRGERPSLTEYAEKHPELAADIRDLFPALMVVEEFASAAGSGADAARSSVGWQAPRQLGEYRILREVGRGGMGVVYEAVQESLGRHVALKVLPGSSLSSRERVDRFRREALTAARLHHTNIVPVFGVGDHEGIHYFAMQFILGQGLDEVLQEVRRLRGQSENIPAATTEARRYLAASAAEGLVTGHFAVQVPAGELPVASALRTEGNAVGPQSGPYSRSAMPSGAGVASPAIASSSTHSGIPSEITSLPGSRYYRSVAEIGVQVAEALHYAHLQGVLHRDVKPSNLLLDTAGRVWVTDFGLAKADDSDDLTRTGELLGTLRYMSPERLQGKALAQSDIYGLGVTLYELLTLRPAFDETHRARLIERVTHEEPSRPRRLDPHIPRDLETVVLKAIAKEPAHRYPSAGEMAADLKRFTDDRPIHARRASFVERLWRWSRRNPLLASMAAALVVVVTALAGGIGWVARDRASRQEALEKQVTGTLDETEGLLAQEKWREALELVERADKLLAAAGRADRPARLLELRKELSMAARLEEIYNRAGTVSDESFVEERFFWGQDQDQRYDQAFREYGLDVDALEPAQFSSRVGRMSVRPALVRALDEWAAMRRRAGARAKARQQPGVGGDNNRVGSVGDERWKRLLEIAQKADPDPWRSRFREALLRRDRVALEEQADSIPTAEMSPATAYLLGQTLQELGAIAKAMAVLRAAQRRHPADFWLNDLLGLFNKDILKPPHYPDALRYYAAALAVRPQNAHAHLGVADVLLKTNALEEGLAECSRAIELEPERAEAWLSRGNIYLRARQYPKAIADYSKAIELDPISAIAWAHRGQAYHLLQQPDKAIRDYDKSLELDPNWPYLWTIRGKAYIELRQYGKALADFGRAIELEPKYVVAWSNQGYVHIRLRQYDQALVVLNKALELDAKFLGAWVNRGATYLLLRHYDKALADLNKAVELNQNDAKARARRGVAYMELQQYDRALSDFSKAIDLDGNCATAWQGRGVLYSRVAKSDKALADCAKAVALEPNEPDFQQSLAWLLATCPQAKLRQGNRALELATKAAQAAPNEPEVWTTLGVARYRACDWKGAIAALQAALKLLKGTGTFQLGAGRSLFFLAMTEEQLGHKKEARQAYERALAWLEANRKSVEERPWLAAELHRFQAEAEEELHIRRNSRSAFPGGLTEFRQ